MRSPWLVGLALSACIQVDLDRDGFSTSFDCDDLDASVHDLDDCDQDGVTVFEDCDDRNPDVGGGDEDCDGALDPYDCDITNPAVGGSVDDADCDGAPDVYECDGADGVPVWLAQDRDCDGFFNAVDCAPDDPELPSEANPSCATALCDAADADCDGVLDADDACPADPTAWLSAYAPDGPAATFQDLSWACSVACNDALTVDGDVIDDRIRSALDLSCVTSISGQMTLLSGGRVELADLRSVGALRLHDPSGTLHLDLPALLTVYGSIEVFTPGSELTLPSILSVGGPVYPSCERTSLYVPETARTVVDPYSLCDWDRQPDPLRP